MSYRVVLVEDNQADIIMITEALRKEAPCQITVFSDGDTAYRYFAERPDDEEPPQLVVLDLNLPVRDGAEVLELIRRHPKMSSVPVAVVSSSPRDVMKSRTAMVDCYVTKPADLDAYLAIGKELLGCVKR